jgi:hypothetical protein
VSRCAAYCTFKYRCAIGEVGELTRRGDFTDAVDLLRSKRLLTRFAENLDS